MKKFVIIFVIIVIVIVGYVGYNYQSSFSEQFIVEKGLVSQKVSETGRLVSSKEYDLTYNVSGEVKDVLVNVGQSVGKGDALIGLDKKELEITLDQARANRQIAQARLNQLLAGAKQEDIQIYEASVSSVEKSVSNAKTAVNNTELSLIDARKNLENVENQADRDLTELYSGVTNILNNAYIKANDAVSRQTEELFIDESTKNPELSFQTSNAVAALDAENQRVAVGIELTKFKSELDNLLNDNTSLDIALTQAEDHLAVIKIFLNQLSYTLETSVGLSDSAVNTYKGYINTGSTNINTALTDINNRQQNILSQLITNESRIDTYKEKVNKTESLLKIVQGDLLEAKAVLQKTEKQLEAVKSGPRMVDQEIFRGQIASKQSEIELLRKRLTDTQLRAPSDGVVTQVNIEIGEKIVAQQVLVSMIGQVRFELEVYIAEENILKIQTDQNIEFSLDAFPSDDRFKAKIISIEPAATMIEAEVYYKVTAEIQEDVSGVLEGMTADVDIITASHDGVVRVPSDTVQEFDDLKFVWVVSGKFRKERRQIETGLSGGGWVEVTRGLYGGEKILNL